MFSALPKTSSSILSHIYFVPQYMCFQFGLIQKFVILLRVHPLRNDKIFEQSKLRAFEADNRNVTKKLNFGMGGVENIVGKGENAGYQHFLLFPQCFQKATFSCSLKVEIVW